MEEQIKRLLIKHGLDKEKVNAAASEIFEFVEYWFSTKQ